MVAIIAVIGAGLCAVLRCALGKYIFSAFTTILCACAVTASGAPVTKYLLTAGLLFSVAGDWLLAHQGMGKNMFLYGVIGFLVAHCLFSGYALTRFSFNAPALFIALALLAFYIGYLFIRALPKIDAPVRPAVALYVLVSIVSVYCAMSMSASPLEKALYIVGIFAILFSDTMIAEGDFLGGKTAKTLILPTYYACHILLALSTIVR